MKLTDWAFDQRPSSATGKLLLLEIAKRGTQITQAQLCEATGLSESAVRRNLHSLACDGLLKLRSTGQIDGLVTGQNDRSAPVKMTGSNRSNRPVLARVRDSSLEVIITPTSPVETLPDKPESCGNGGLGEKPSLPKNDPRGTRLPTDWQASDADYRYALDQGLNNTQTAAIEEDFRDYWLSKPGAAARKTDWPRTWQVWVRREAAKRGVRRTGESRYGSSAIRPSPHIFGPC
jgi:MarR family